VKEPVEVEARLRWQAMWCRQLGSPLYGSLLERVADDYRRGGPVYDAIRDHEELPSGAAFGLRLMGGVHRVALLGEVPGLARCYPSCGGTADEEAAWDALRALAADRPAEFRSGLYRPVQTNEVGRSAALICGFLYVAEFTQLPLALLEIGASAGLNLRWDHFRYDAPRWTWGDPTAALTLTTITDPPPFNTLVTVVERAGCDAAPVDPTTEEGRLTLVSYVWADQVERLKLLRAGLEVARRVPATVERRKAVEWTREQLANRRSDATTIVYHSVVWDYLTNDEQVELTEVIQTAARDADPAAPVGWLSFEPGQPRFEVRLRLWPGDLDVVVADAGPHGADVRWRL
jgi:hypothetical protein